MNPEDRITTDDQLKALTPEQIVEADDAGRIDVSAIAAERNERQRRQRERGRTIAGHVTAGSITPDAADQWSADPLPPPDAA